MALKACKECRKEVAVGAATCPHCGTKWPAGKKTPWTVWALGATALVVLVTCFNTLSDLDTTSAGGTPAPPPGPSPKQLAADSLSLEFEWTTGGFDNVMMADFTLKNSGSRTVKDFEIRCTLSGPSGTDIDRVQKVVYERVTAGQTRRFRSVNMGFMSSQAKSARCGIEDFVLE